MTGTGAFPYAAPASGAYPITTGLTTSMSVANANNSADVANYAWAGVDSAPISVRCMTTGSETYAITSGSVVTINGTTIDGISVAVDDIVFIPTAPGSAGPGTAISSGVGSSQPGNGLYYVTAVATNISLSRAGTMSSTSAQPNPAGRVVFVRPGGTVNGLTMWIVNSPTGDATFTYGTTALQFKNYSYATLTNSPLIVTPTIQSPTFTGTGVPNAAIQQGINNFNTSLQTQPTVAATKYYVAGSALAMPASALTGMTANATTFVWNIGMAKNAQGTGTFQVLILRGTNGTTADTADVTQTIGTQTAALDNMFLTIQLTVTTIGASGAYYWSMCPDSKAVTATGFGCATGTLFNGTVSSVALNTASLKFGIGFIANTGGTLPTITIPTVQSFAFNVN